MLAFVNQDEAVRPDGKRGAGLLAYLRGLQSSNGDKRRDVIATVFEGVINRMISGYLLRDVINLVDGIHFDSTEEIHTLGHLYESMLREMRDAAGDSGEFYTPGQWCNSWSQSPTRSLAKPCSTRPAAPAGSWPNRSHTWKNSARPSRTARRLQEKSILGGEAKPLPYMLAQMNLLLHGLESPAHRPTATAWPRSSPKSATPTGST